MLKTILNILAGRIILIPLAAISTLIVSNALGPANFGFVASVVAISTFFSVTLLGPPSTLILKKSSQIEDESTITIKQFYLFSGFMYFCFLISLFFVEDSRILNQEALILLILTFFAGLNSFVANYFFYVKKMNFFNFHTVLPEVVFFIVILTLITSLDYLSIKFVLFAWIIQTGFVCLLVLNRKEIISKHIFNKKYLKRDYISFFLLGFLNMGRERALIFIGPIAFPLNEIGKLAFYMMIARVFISLNGTVSNLVMSQHSLFKRKPIIYKIWIISLLAVSFLFFCAIFLFNQTGFLMAFHISFFQMIAMSTALLSSLIFSLYLRRIYVEYNLEKFSRHQTVITVIILVFAILVKDIFDLFTIHMFITSSMALSIGVYTIFKNEIKSDEKRVG